jgi:precorrin-2 dehydrogenase/sirohydrochlorin ferrochelatase
VPLSSPGYPVNLLVAGKRCLVVGGGAVAARKVEGLLAAGAEVRVVATEVGSAMRSLAVPFEERPYAPGDLRGCWLVITATGDPAVNAAVAAEADEERIWVNAADDPPSCTFSLPAVVRQGPVSVAVATGGHSPSLAGFLRAYLSELIGPEWATMALLLSAARERMQAEGRSTEEPDWRAVVSWDMLDLIRSGQLDLAKERIEAWLSSSSD